MEGGPHARLPSTFDKRWRMDLSKVKGRRDCVEGERAKDMALHLELATHENLRAGMRPRRGAPTCLHRLCGVERYTQQKREVRALDWIGRMALD